MNRVTKALWQRRLTYRIKRVSYWRSKGNITLVNKWVRLVREAKAKLTKPARPQKGIDVSVHNGSVDWKAVRAAGITFAYAKSTEGEDYRDSTWTKERVTAMRRAGVQFGPYHYLRPRAGRSGGAEARWFINNAYAAGWGKPGDLVACLDFEETTALSPAQTITYLKQAVDEVVRLTGRKPIIYTGSYFWNDHGGKTSWGCPLWLAAYDVTAPKLPNAWRQWTIWQHTATGAVKGVSSANVDQNIARSLPHL